MVVYCRRVGFVLALGDWMVDATPAKLRLGAPSRSDGAGATDVLSSRHLALRSGDIIHRPRVSIVLAHKHGLVNSMSGVGNCYDNAVAESFFGLLKRERVHRRRYRTRAEARTYIFDYIERFYNRQRRLSYSQGLPPEIYATTGITNS